MTLMPEDRQQLIEHSRAKAYNIEQEISCHIQNQQLFTAVNRIYYAIYYMLPALALKHEFSTSKHTQLIGWFNKHFVKTGKIDAVYTRYIQEAFEKRMKGDYDVLTTFSESEVRDLFEKMKHTLRAIEQLL
ncbi:UPF0332 protein TM_1000 [Candidatus Vecturithrix granuli]|uniref:UPF0332 protein TM_1000 n=1 Tax=Vecturithrix granuli TaxID=1499967 RepID=A0A081CAX4_VECG1|nr:UPF0332 protein TM_1000 [Candidatus Vecturithrix granuli]